jgi:hypothetical protein
MGMVNITEVYRVDMESWYCRLVQEKFDEWYVVCVMCVCVCVCVCVMCVYVRMCFSVYVRYLYICVYVFQCVCMYIILRVHI